MLIGELAKVTGVTKDTIRHYDELGLLVSTHRKAGSRLYKEYLPQNVSRVALIRNGKDLGFQLAELRELTRAFDAGELSDEEVIELLQSKLTLVRGKIESLKETETLLLRKLALYK